MIEKIKEPPKKEGYPKIIINCHNCEGVYSYNEYKDINFLGKVACPFCNFANSTNEGVLKFDETF